MKSRRTQQMKKMKFSYEELLKATGGFSLDHLIGKGSHGFVYKGVLTKDKLEVAIKKPSLGLQHHKDTTKIDNEIDILSSVSNPYIVTLLGVSHGCVDSYSKLLVMEFMPNGSLDDLLHSPAAAPSPPSWRRRAAIALQVAHALQCLHSSMPPVVHRDIKPANILLDKGSRARLADFSLAVKLADGGSGGGAEKSPAAGTLGYMDPCYTAPETVGPKNDVFSFGVLMLELISGRRAVDSAREPASLLSWALQIIKNGGEVDDLCDPRVGLSRNMIAPVGQMVGLAVRCVSLEEEVRPTMAVAVAELERVVKDLRRGRWLRVAVDFKIREIVDRFVGAWRRKESRVTTIITTTTIVCNDHLHN